MTHFIFHFFLFFLLFTFSKSSFSHDFSPYCKTPVNGKNTLNQDILTARPLTGGKLARHRFFAAEAAKNKPEIVFLGDSILAQIPHDLLEKFFPQKNIANYALSGERIEGLLWRLQDKSLPDSVKVILLSIGANHAGTNTNVEVGRGVEKLVDDLHAAHKSAQILLLHIPPAGEKPATGYRRQIRCIHKELMRLAPRPYVSFVSVADLLLDEKGFFRKDLSEDFIHPNRKAYLLILERLKTRITKLKAAKKSL